MSRLLEPGTSALVATLLIGATISGLIAAWLVPALRRASGLKDDAVMGIVLGAFDDSLQFEPKSEIFTNYKMKWLRDYGCIKESFEEAAVIERIQLLMENLDQRG